MTYLEEKLKEMTKKERKVTKTFGPDRLEISTWLSFLTISSIINIEIIIFGMLSIVGVINPPMIAIEFIFFCLLVFIVIDITINPYIKIYRNRYHYITEKSFDVITDINEIVENKCIRNTLIDICIDINTLSVIYQAECDSFAKHPGHTNSSINEFYIVSESMKKIMNVILDDIKHGKIDYSNLLNRTHVSMYKKIIESIVASATREYYNHSNLVFDDSKGISENIESTITITKCKVDIIDNFDKSITSPSKVAADCELLRRLFSIPFSGLSLPFIEKRDVKRCGLNMEDYELWMN